MEKIDIRIILEGDEATEFEVARAVFNARQAEALEPQVKAQPFGKMLIRKGAVLMKAESNGTKK